jgi:hypothetical protein
MYYAAIARQFKVDSTESGKVSADNEANAPRVKTGAKSDHAA